MAAVLAHVAQLAVAFAILDRSRAALGRISVLALFAAIHWFRTAHRASPVPRESFSWRDAALAAGATGVYQIAFAELGATSGAPLGALDGAALIFYLGGATLSTAAEVVRRRFGSYPGRGSHLCTVGPYVFVRYPKYLGDLAWASGWALATRAGAAWMVVAGHAAILVLVYVPALDRRLAVRYGAEFREWAERTRRIVPFVY